MKKEEGERRKRKEGGVVDHKMKMNDNNIVVVVYNGTECNFSHSFNVTSIESVSYIFPLLLFFFPPLPLFSLFSLHKISCCKTFSISGMECN